MAPRTSGLPLDDVRRAAEGAADSRQVDWMARAGLTARALVYLLIGVSGLLMVHGAAGANVDQKGALTQLTEQPYGWALVAAMAIGFLGYAVWRISEAAFGVTGEPNRPVNRLKSLGRGLIYLAITATAVGTLRGSRSTQADQQESFTAWALGHPVGA